MTYDELIPEQRTRTASLPEKTDGPKMDRTSRFARSEYFMGSVHS